MSATLIAAIVAVVLGGLGLVGGLIGYVQGAAALRRATLARQRAASAEEAALQASARADAAARAAEGAIDRARDLGADPGAPVTGSTETVQAPVPVQEAAAEPAEAPAAELVDAPQADAEEPPASNARTSGGQVVAGGQEAPPMDWAEALRTGSIPLPARSRGTYASPRRPKPTGQGPARFELRTIGRQRFEAVNVGGAEAADAIVEGLGDDAHLIRPLAIGPATVVPGGSLPFSVLRVEGRSVTAVLRWRVDGETASQELAVE